MANLQKIKEKNQYPYSFFDRKELYILYEETTNSTVEELEKIIDDKKCLVQFIGSSYQTDFYQYVTKNFSELSAERKSSLFLLALEEVKRYSSSPLVEFIINKKDFELLPYKEFVSADSNGVRMYSISEEISGKSDEEIEVERYKRWCTLLQELYYDQSQMFYLLENYHVFFFSSPC